MGRFVTAVLFVLAGLGWAAALRERDRCEEIKRTAKETVGSIRHDIAGTRLRTP